MADVPVDKSTEAVAGESADVATYVAEQCTDMSAPGPNTNLFSLALQIFHYGNGVPYIEKWGQFRGRVEWVGDISKQDGSIVIRNLDYIDNGTFTCDVKNPPDVVGTSSDVHLTVYDRSKLNWPQPGQTVKPSGSV